MNNIFSYSNASLEARQWCIGALEVLRFNTGEYHLLLNGTYSVAGSAQAVQNWRSPNLEKTMPSGDKKIDPTSLEQVKNLCYYLGLDPRDIKKIENTILKGGRTELYLNPTNYYSVNFRQTICLIFNSQGEIFSYENVFSQMPQKQLLELIVEGTLREKQLLQNLQNSSKLDYSEEIELQNRALQVLEKRLEILKQKELLEVTLALVPRATPDPGRLGAVAKKI